MEEIVAAIEADESSPEPPQPEPRRDPAQVVAEVMLEAILMRPDQGLDTVRAPGTIVCVLVQGADWIDPVRRAWRRDVSGQESTHNANSYSSPDSRTPRTYTFATDREPSKPDRDRHNDVFARVVAQGHSTVAIAPEVGWLPPDLVAAMDHEIVVGTPWPLALSEAARRLTGSRATSALTEEEAARVTPRLLRLSIRPNQNADDYLLRLRKMLSREAAIFVSRVPQPRTVRDEPTLDRIHGMNEAVRWGFQLRDDLDAYRKGERSWSDVDGGLLLSGPPGTGKTLFARALAATCDVPLVSGSYGSWLSTGTAHQGDLLKAMRQAFRDAKAAAPAVLFIDEVDGFADRARVKHFAEWHTEVVNTLLAELDGVEDRQGVVVIGACNDPGRLDPALVRSGRLDRHIRIGLPNASALSAILRVHLGEEVPGADLGRVGMLLLGSTGADVERIVRGARRRARLAGRRVEMTDVVSEAGGEDGRSGEDLLLAAVHEAGHAVSAAMLGFGIEGVTLRGSADRDGLTGLLRGPNQVTAADVYDRMVVHLSGRAAEEVLLKRVTSGAGGAGGSDLQRATLLAVRSAAELGLEEEHGLLWTPLPDQETDLSGMLAQDPRLASLVRARLADAYNGALNLLEEKRDAVRAVADRLLENGTLYPEEIGEILGGEAIVSSFWSVFLRRCSSSAKFGFIGHILSLIIRMQAGVDIGRIILSGPDVLVDGTAVQFVKRALPELATNALKHGALGPRGGKVEISWVEETEDGRGIVLLRWQESCELDAPSDPAGSGGGTRLLNGLALTLGVTVDRMSNGGGYLYSFRLPTGRTHRAVGSTNAPRILLLDDDLAMRAMAGDSFLEAGYDIVEVGSAADALQVIASGQAFDAALLDLHLGGGGDSLPVADALSARGVPFFFLSGFMDDVVFGRHAGVLKLRKPLSMKLLVARVAAVIGPA